MRDAPRPPNILGKNRAFPEAGIALYYKISVAVISKEFIDGLENVGATYEPGRLVGE